jgi:hypothetical protein
MNSKGQNKGQLALFFERPSGNPYGRIPDDEEADLPLPLPELHPETQKASAQDSVASTLRGELDEVLGFYRPYVASGEWDKVLAYRDEFLREATRTPEKASRVRSRLTKLRVELLPMEKIECNRAPAEQIIQALRRMLE